MSDITPKDGGPAFPRPTTYAPENDGPILVGSQGMSLRDWFAGQALPALIERSRVESWPKLTGTPEEEVVAHAAYMFADAMIEERKR